MTPRRSQPSEALLAHPVIAVLRTSHARQYGPVIEALIAGGVRSIELTLTTEGVFEEIRGLKARFAGSAEIGVGTVTNPNDAEQALDAGADYLVTPVTVPEVIRAAVNRGVPVFPGAYSPTEMHTAWSLGAAAVKLFPASVVGPGYIGQLRGPFPDLPVIPSGGVSIQDAPKWIKAGALAVSLGGPLLGDAFKGGDLTALTARAAEVTRLVAHAQNRTVNA
ncbi:bifunctional 4-hydroxy-2-oxoglutarate aldolase/2-dehydro-3-deoxy-phosphogluconate aldolase [Arthrobacter sp. ISL-85]|uniref:bifunctional 4-hydroxy-2-oxoglutarate aldolase/2-dehydro-3-deoxy-phosphogluconate aldolase n=1 Tax=Arthrobacter sp. ISL-85 TaxID=2819115 RepID=UPI001BE93BC5|nr:bifunctional 4-hydroxy-2-oxoglutarate aldolase/2-dehydro-3-deoxy-phosphogluconate aldolase [Arthrobacter sp. ISL-85]MBT2566279.1 bifunctional 4-hydroxy-2-oxoglutarate aldolase/2-dehydro-3-deoxy-phosphogluconate aldolase [Arthrobacter sp. ISL-85]